MQLHHKRRYAIGGAILLGLLGVAVFLVLRPSEPEDMPRNAPVPEYLEYAAPGFYRFSYKSMNGTEQQPEAQKCYDPAVCEYIDTSWDDGVLLAFPSLSFSEGAMLHAQGIPTATTDRLYRFAIGIKTRFVSRGMTAAEVVAQLRKEDPDAFITTADERATYSTPLGRIVPAYLVFDPKKYQPPADAEGDMQYAPAVVRIDLLPNNKDRTGFGGRTLVDLQGKEVQLATFYSSHAEQINSIVQSFKYDWSEKR